jgi:mannobiose 2-epimerase
MIIEELKRCYNEIYHHLNSELTPFWEKNGVDSEYGGYFVVYDENGNRNSEEDKYIVTQTRMIWAYSFFARNNGNKKFLEYARQGYEFFVNHFWDQEYGGWYWRTRRDGSVVDDGKVVYGQTFAIYSLSEYALASGDKQALDYAERTFDLMQKYCTDTANGGYYENLERDWSLSAPGFAAGDLKSLDIHMHTLEAFTTLYQCSGKEIHKRKLIEVIDVILNKMMNQKIGCGYNQFDIRFNRKPAINIRRTWNAERETGEVMKEALDTTSYGHNMELVWLLDRANDVLGQDFHTYDSISEKILEHSIRYGFDRDFGGVYRDGPHEGEAYIKDKEWWQNCEVLVGFLDAYEHHGDEKYLDYFIKQWDFDRTYMINHELGEWRQLLKRDGTPLVSDMGNIWKAMYHTGRAVLESKMRLEKILKVL